MFANTSLILLPALLQKLVGDFFIFRREIWWEIWRESFGEIFGPTK